MKKNMGLPDRIIRVMLATVPIVLYFAGIITGVVTIVLLGITGILLITSLFSFCPLYALFKINTDKKLKQ